MRKQEITRMLGISWNAVHAWSKRMESGQSCREVRPPGMTSGLDSGQKKRLMVTRLKGALTRGHPADLWTPKRVVELIWNEFGVESYVTHAWRVLRDMGFSRRSRCSL